MNFHATKIIYLIMMEYIRLNLQYMVRNEKECSYIVRKKQLIDEDVSDISEDITMVPSFIGYILTNIGKDGFESSVKAISSNLGVSSESIISFVKRITAAKPQRMKMLGSNIVLPQNILINSHEKDEREYLTSPDFRATDRFVEKRPNSPIDINFMITTKCTTNCEYCYAKRDLQEKLSLTDIRNIIKQCYDIGVVNLALTGGDIFARQDWKEILSCSIAFGFHPFLSTKTLPKEKDIAFLNTLGISELQFSLDSLSPNVLSTMIGKSSSYLNQVKEMFDMCSNKGIKLIIRSVITKHNETLLNFKELYSFISQYNNIYYWSITPAFLSEFKKEVVFRPSNQQLAEISIFVNSLSTSFPIYLNKINNDGYKLRKYDSVDDFVQNNQICHANTYSMSILPSGICTPCEMLYENPDFILGNIQKESIYNIWNSKKAWSLYMPEQKSMNNNDSPCVNCKVFDLCRKSVDKHICLVDISKTLGVGKGNYPDPRCPKSQAMNVIL